MKSQRLIELESLVQRLVANMTNDMYANNIKISYRLEFKKGEGTILDDKGKEIKNYYYLRLYLIDKRESIVGKIVELYLNYYPIKFPATEHIVHEEALRDLIFNGIKTLTNTLYALHLERQKKDIVKVEDVKLDENVEAIKESAETPSLILPNDKQIIV